MKIKKSLICLIPATVAALSSCSFDDNNDSTWEQYAEWRQINEQWLDEQASLTGPDGKPLYTKVVPAWNENAYVLMHWYNDTMVTKDNLRPLYTSTIDVKYIGRLYNDEPFDSSYLNTQPADSIYRCLVSTNIPGWVIAMERMHVGDSVSLLIPYAQGYGSSSAGSLIKPYSALQFDIKLVDIPAEYVKP